MAKPEPQQQQTANLPAVQKMTQFRQELALREKAYVPLLPAHIPWAKFQASVWAAVANNNDLLECNRATMFKACAESAELGLSLNPSLKEADILKVWNKRLNGGRGGYEAQFRPRFMGLMKLAKQSGEIKNIVAHEVYEWDEFSYEHGLDEHLRHVPGKKPEGYDKLPNWGITHAYCIWTLADGTKQFEVMDATDLLRIMMRSSSKNKEGEVVGPWMTDRPEMCRKTVVRRSSKYMPLSAEKMKPFATAVNLDDRREGGEEVTIDHGDVVDVTDSGPEPEQGQESDAGKSQMDDLEGRMQQRQQAQPRQAEPQTKQQDPASAGQQQPRQQATKPQQQSQPKKQPPTIDNPPQPKQQEQAQAQPKPRIERLEPPQGDMVTWVRLAEAAVQALTDPAARKAWRTIHADLLDACEYSCPDEIDALIKMLPE